MNVFPLTITNISEVLFDAPVVSVTCPGIEGDLTVLAGHTPLITNLKTGAIHIRMQNGEEKTISVSRGILEVGKKQATILL